MNFIVGHDFLLQPGGESIVSIFWELLYWEVLEVRHAIDVSTCKLCEAYTL